MLSRLAFIGAGRLGTALALRLHQLGYPITGIYSRTTTAAQRLAAQVNAPALSTFPDADIVFLTVPDDAIRGIATALAQNPLGGAVVHTSGVHSLEALHPLANIGSFHPVYPFTEGTRLTGKEAMLIGIEAASPTLQAQLVALGTALGGHPALIKAGQKARYHAAAVFASNYLVTLFQISMNLMQEAGIAPDLARPALANIMQGNINNLRQLDPAQALTGPIARGDLETINKHLAVLGSNDYAKIYRELAQLTAAYAPALSPEQRHALAALLN